MTQELVGLQFLKKNLIKDKPCNLDKPFAFISYAHDEHDAQIVRNVFLKLYERGFNLWIDTANIPYDENSWKAAAMEALMDYDTCKAALFFRSEEAMKRDTIQAELETIKARKYPIITVDIWKDTNLSAEKFKKHMLATTKFKEYAVVAEICKIVNVDNSAIRLAADLGNNIDELVEEIAEQLEGKDIKGSGIKKNEKEDSHVKKTVPELLNPPQPPTPPVPVSLTYTDTIEDFEYFFKNLREEYKSYWQSTGNPGNTPTINIELKIYFNCACMENHCIKGHALKSMFVEMMEYFYQMSGERYFDYILPLCARDKKGKVLKNPMIITEEYWSNGGVNQGAYSEIKGSRYLFYNWYGAPELLGAVIKQIEMYMKFLNENGQKASLEDVTVQYTFMERKLAQMMAEIREAGKNGKKRISKKENEGTDSMGEAATVAFAPEALMNFRYRFKKISDDYSVAYKKEHDVKKTPPIPFSNITIHFPEDVINKAEIMDDNWKPLFNKVMDVFCEFTNGAFCEWRMEQEALKNNKEPLVASEESYTEGKITCARYQPICGGKYYFYNSYGAPELLRAMEDEIRAYMNYLAITKGCQEDIESVKISYELPEGYYADLFQGKCLQDAEMVKRNMRVVGSSAELINLLESDECKDTNLKKLLKENKIQIRISSSDISFREEYTKYNIWLFSFDKAEPDADKWDFYLLRKGNMDTADRTCYDATDLTVSAPIKNSIRKSHLEGVRKVTLDELLSGKWTDCFVKE